jgi:hypothetical protein
VNKRFCNGIFDFVEFSVSCSDACFANFVFSHPHTRCHGFSLWCAILKYTNNRILGYTLLERTFWCLDLSKILLFCFIVNLYLMNVTLSSALSANSRIYIRYGSDSNCYFETFQITVPVAGEYHIMTTGLVDTYGYLYINGFFVNSLATNLIAFDDDGSGSDNFKLSNVLQPNVKYYLVVTTYSSYTVGEYTVVVSGLSRANITLTNNTLPPSSEWTYFSSCDQSSCKSNFVRVGCLCEGKQYKQCIYLYKKTID